MDAKAGVHRGALCGGGTAARCIRPGGQRSSQGPPSARKVGEMQMKSRGRYAIAFVLTLLLAPCCGTSEAATPLAVHVQGNHLVDASGNFLRLLGINRSGSEYMCVGGSSVFDGPVDAAAIAAIKAWHVNAVRVPL